MKSPFAVIGEALQSSKGADADNKSKPRLSAQVQFSLTPFGTSGTFVPVAGDAAVRSAAQLKEATDTAAWNLGEAYTAFTAHREKILLHLQGSASQAGSRQLSSIPALQGVMLQQYYSCAMDLSVSLSRVRYLQHQAARAGISAAISDVQACAAMADPSLRSEQLAWTAQVLLQCTLCL